MLNMPPLEYIFSLGISANALASGMIEYVQIPRPYAHHVRIDLVKTSGH